MSELSRHSDDVTANRLFPPVPVFEFQQFLHETGYFSVSLKCNTPSRQLVDLAEWELTCIYSLRTNEGSDDSAANTHLRNLSDFDYILLCDLPLSIQSNDQYPQHGGPA